MITLPDREALLSFATCDLPAGVQEHVARHVALAAESDLLDLTHLLIIQAGDTGADIEREIGFSPLVHPIDAAPFGSKDFRPYWDWLANLRGWFELILTVGNDGFAYILLVADQPHAIADMCRRYSE